MVFRRAAAALKKPTTEPVKFEFFAPEAKHVHVAGCFTGWEKNPLLLKLGKDGHWSVTTELEPGNYEYRFLVDGRWESDQKARESVANPFGSTNSIVKVGKA